MIEYPGFRHETRIQLRFKDLDPMGHVNNANHFSYMELARVNYFHDVISHTNDWTQDGFILAKMTIDYKKPVFLIDDISVMTRCIRLGNKSFDLEYALIKKGDETLLLATGLSVIVCYNYMQKTSVVIPADWVKKIKSFENPD